MQIDEINFDEEVVEEVPEVEPEQYLDMEEEV